MCEVSVAENDDGADWQQYVDSLGSQHHAHCWQWRNIIQETFSHKPYYLVAKKDGKIQGILPLFHVKSFLFGSALISMPYLNSGGVLGSNDAAVEELLMRAKELVTELAADYLELRHRSEVEYLKQAFEVRSHKVAAVLKLPDNPEALFASFPPKLRSQIRRPSKSGIYAEVSPIPSADDSYLNDFYDVFSEHMRDLGTPVFPKKLFKNSLRRFNRGSRVIRVIHENKTIAAGITIQNKKYVEIPWASSLFKYKKESPNMLLYWEAIKVACENGATAFDFGRSTIDSGPHRFKKQWNTEMIPLYWYYHVGKGEIPEINPNSERFKKLVQIWQRLPIGVANSVGPWVTRNLP